MKIGDLVINGQGHTGIVVGLGYMGNIPNYDECHWVNPDVHVMTPSGKRLWSFNALKIISESF
tara:strand:+ start:12452 stop:12640 length:189 start_codon:yes stop_codon:yes gene_type:complete